MSAVLADSRQLSQTNMRIVSVRELAPVGHFCDTFPPGSVFYQKGIAMAFIKADSFFADKNLTHQVWHAAVLLEHWAGAKDRWVKNAAPRLAKALGIHRKNPSRILRFLCSYPKENPFLRKNPDIPGSYIIRPAPAAGKWDRLPLSWLKMDIWQARLLFFISRYKIKHQHHKAAIYINEIIRECRIPGDWSESGAGRHRDVHECLKTLVQIGAISDLEQVISCTINYSWRPSGGESKRGVKTQETTSEGSQTRPHIGSQTRPHRESNTPPTSSTRTQKTEPKEEKQTLPPVVSVSPPKTEPVPPASENPKEEVNQKRPENGDTRDQDYQYSIGHQTIADSRLRRLWVAIEKDAGLRESWIEDRNKLASLLRSLPSESSYSDLIKAVREIKGDLDHPCLLVLCSDPWFSKVVQKVRWKAGIRLQLAIGNLDEYTDSSGNLLLAVQRFAAQHGIVNWTPENLAAARQIATDEYAARHPESTTDVGENLNWQLRD